MEMYPKINALYKRHNEGKKKGKFIMGDFACPEFEYLFNNKWEWTEKVDGTNIRIYNDPFVHPDDQVRFGGRTDNAQIPKELLTHLQSTFNVELFHKAFFDPDAIPPRVTLYGEGYGPKIQSGGKYREDASFVLFDVQVGDAWLSRNNVDDVARKMGLDSVPVIHYGNVQDAIDIVSSGYIFNKEGGIIRFGRQGLESKWGSFEAEGLIGRPVVPLFDRKGNRVTVKIKAVDFK